MEEWMDKLVRFSQRCTNTSWITSSINSASIVTLCPYLKISAEYELKINANALWSPLDTKVHNSLWLSCSCFTFLRYFGFYVVQSVENNSDLQIFQNYFHRG